MANSKIVYDRFSKVQLPVTEGFIEYPKMIYPGGPGRPGVVVQSANEEIEILKANKMLDATEAKATPEKVSIKIDGKKKLVSTEPYDKTKADMLSYENKKAALLQEAWKLGIPIDKRWTLSKIEARIEEGKQK